MSDDYWNGEFNVRSALGANPGSLSVCMLQHGFAPEHTPDEDGYMQQCTVNSIRAAYDLMGWEINSFFVCEYYKETGVMLGRDSVRKKLDVRSAAGEYINKSSKFGLLRARCADIKEYANECAQRRSDGIRARTQRMRTDVSAGSAIK